MKLSLKKNSFWNIGNYGFSIVSLFFLFPFMIRHLGDSNYGFFIFLGTINGMATIANFGFGEATLRFVALYYNANNKEKLREILSTSFWTYLVLGCITSLCIVFFAEEIIYLLKGIQIEKNLAINLLRISALTFFIRFIVGIYSTIPQALQRFDISSKITIVETILRVLFYIVILNLDYGIEGVVLTEFTLAIIMSFINIIVSSRLINTYNLFEKPTRIAFNEIFSYSIFSFLSQIVGLLWQYADRLLLGYFIGTTAIAYFAVPQQIIFKILGLVSAGSMVLLPRFSMIKLDEPSKKVFKDFTIISLLFSIVVFSTLAFVVKDFIALWISPSFSSEAKTIAIILSISCMVRGAFPIYQNLFNGIGKPLYNLYIIIASSLIIVILDFILIPILGLEGAGIAYLVSPIVGVITIFLIWKNILLDPLMEPIKFYFIPLFLGYSFLGVAFLLKNYLGYEPSWGMIIVQSILFGSIQILLIYFYFRIFVPNEYKNLVKLQNAIRL